MKRVIVFGILTVLFITTLSACGNTVEPSRSQETQNLPQNTISIESEEDNIDNTMVSDLYTIDTAISDVMGDPAFGD